jgi:aspartate/methionine/tyrosine aminotransferase
MPGFYGDPDLRARIAARYGLGEDHLILAAGTSLANFIISAVSLDPGDDAIVEVPTYEALPRIVEMLGGRVIHLPRRHDDQFKVDPDLLREIITPRTRIIFLTSLHNPSGVAIPESTLREIGEIATGVGARVIVDEVYLEYLPPGTFPPAVTLGDPFVSTSSVTKAYGLGGLRVGWAVGPEDLIQRAHELHDLLDVECSAPSQSIACHFLDRIEEFRSRTEAHLRGNLPIILDWCEKRDDVDCVPPDGGATVFPWIRSPISTEEISRLLLQDHETVAVPGEFFGAPHHLRLGFGSPQDALREALQRLGRTLDAQR